MSKIKYNDNFVLKIILDTLKWRYKDKLIDKELYDKAVKYIKKEFKGESL